MQQLTNYQELLNCHGFATLTTELFIILVLLSCYILHKSYDCWWHKTDLDWKVHDSSYFMWPCMWNRKSKLYIFIISLVLRPIEKKKKNKSVNEADSECNTHKNVDPAHETGCKKVDTKIKLKLQTIINDNLVVDGEDSWPWNINFHIRFHILEVRDRQNGTTISKSIVPLSSLRPYNQTCFQNLLYICVYC